MAIGGRPMALDRAWRDRAAVERHGYLANSDLLPLVTF
jgi:hypothetical protein